MSNLYLWFALILNSNYYYFKLFKYFKLKFFYTYCLLFQLTNRHTHVFIVCLFVCLFVLVHSVTLNQY